MSTTQRKWTCTAVMVAVSMLGTGCAGIGGGPAVKVDATAEPIMAAMTPAERAAFERLYQEGERNAVLNYNELGLAAMEAGHFDMAETAFGEAIQRIERVYANDENAKNAKSVWSEERVKDFKGEPYERAMAYYYRGLLYLRTGDFQNARASFQSAEFQDTVSEKEEFQGDFALMNYMAAWSSSCDGDTDKAQDFMKVAVQKDDGLSSLTATRPAMFLLETGRGPVKSATGKHRELLVFADAGTPAPTPKQLSIDGRTADHWVRAGDVVFQATTRGGRPVQAILDGKAQWKDGTHAAGEAMVTVGAATAMSGVMSNNSDLASAGGYAALIGMALDVASSAMKATADTRQWASLPRDIYVMEWDQPVADASAAEAEIVRPDAVAGTARLTWLRQSGTCQIAWGRARDDDAAAAAARKLEPARGKRDDAFRQELVEKLAPRGVQS